MRVAFARLVEHLRSSAELRTPVAAHAPRAAGAPLLIAVFAVLLTGCGGESRDAGREDTDPLLVMAPSSMSGAMSAIVEAFENATGTEVDLVLGATGNLASQIENGAPADVFLSADEATVDRLIVAGLLREESRRVYAQGSLALIWSEAISEPPRSLSDLAAERFSVIGIANPEIAPYGAAARQALEAEGVLSTVQGRLVVGENIVQTYQFVATGNADAALVARSVVVEAGDTIRLLAIDPGLHAPILHAGALVAASDHPMAEPFLDHVTGETGAAVMLRAGFQPAAE